MGSSLPHNITPHMFSLINSVAYQLEQASTPSVHYLCPPSYKYRQHANCCGKPLCVVLNHLNSQLIPSLDSSKFTYSRHYGYCWIQRRYTTPIFPYAYSDWSFPSSRHSYQNHELFLRTAQRELQVYPLTLSMAPRHPRGKREPENSTEKILRISRVITIIYKMEKFS